MDDKDQLTVLLINLIIIPIVRTKCIIIIRALTSLIQPHNSRVILPDLSLKFLLQDNKLIFVKLIISFLPADHWLLYLGWWTNQHDWLFASLKIFIVVVVHKWVVCCLVFAFHSLLFLFFVIFKFWWQTH